jgi:hypothetical protein
MRPANDLSVPGASRIGRRLAALLAIGVVTVAMAACSPSASPTDGTESAPESAPPSMAPSETPAS